MIQLQYKYKDTKLNPSELETPSEIYPESLREKWTKNKINQVMQNMELIGDDEQFVI